MIFHEIYSAYYRTVSEILKLAVKGKLTNEEMKELVSKHAFSESALTIIPNLKSGKWKLLTPELTTPLQHVPTLPVSLLEKRWLKAVFMDPRIRLFTDEPMEFGDVEPLFTPDDYVVYDRFADGDPYFDEGYVRRFRMILSGIHEKNALQIELVNKKGKVVRMHVLPCRLEYSEKDDKFRLICKGDITVNLARILTCQRYNGKIAQISQKVKEKRCVTLQIKDERNTLERCLLHFSHFEKNAKRLSENEYEVNIFYDQNDETEMVIRILRFGPTVEVVAPACFRNLIKMRLIKQKSCE